eukprot:GGOE01007392.1.p1 GENE.GGOE01007392.1~~GGOE01007392.1.p1  ORF type:complete len:826 (-),score=54.57 GGOE01007392.1:1281-3599(-)
MGGMNTAPPMGFRDFGKGRGKGKGGKGGKGKGRSGGKNNFQQPSVPLFEQGTKVEDITATSFEELGVHPRLCELLARNGFMAPFPIQSLCIPEALQGRDVCGKAKTGSGKTLAFGLPLLQMLEPTRERGYPSALILVPTRELALQVHQVLSSLRGPLNVEVAYGGSENRKFQVNALLRKPVDILAACPGRLLDFCEAGIISLAKISHLVLDEADRMAEMGFQEQVDDILRRIGDDHQRQTMLFSATLDSSVDQLVKRHMTQPVHHQIAEKTVTVDQMTHRFLQLAHGRDKMPICAALCCLPGLEKVLVFVRTKLGVDDLTAALKHNYRIRALAIHGDKTQTARERTLQAFDKGDLHVLVATDVAARGLDIRRVDFVINYDAPEGVDGHKIYLHRSGRTARAGKSGLVTTLAARGDQEQDVEAIRRRLNIREPVHKVTPKDAANLVDVLGLEEFLMEFNEGRRTDPRIEQSRQRILRDIEEGGPMHMVGLGGYSTDNNQRGKGKGGKGKGMQNSYNNFSPQQQQHNGYHDFSQGGGGMNMNTFGQGHQQTTATANPGIVPPYGAVTVGGHSAPAYGAHGVQTSIGTHGMQATHGAHGVQDSHGTHGVQAGHGTHGAQGDHGTYALQATHGAVAFPYGARDSGVANMGHHHPSHGNAFAGVQPQVGQSGHAGHTGNSPFAGRTSFGTHLASTPYVAAPYGGNVTTSAPHPAPAGQAFGGPTSAGFGAHPGPSYGVGASNPYAPTVGNPYGAPPNKGYPAANSPVAAGTHANAGY